MTTVLTPVMTSSVTSPTDQPLSLTQATLTLVHVAAPNKTETSLAQIMTPQSALAPSSTVQQLVPSVETAVLAPVDATTPARNDSKELQVAAQHGRLPSNEPASRHNHFNNILPPCVVCGGKATGFHYGVNSCEACKGFFRRCLDRKETHYCNKEGKCEILVGRRSCSACRYTKCLKNGMSKNAIKLGRYTHEKKAKNIEAAKQAGTVGEAMQISPLSSPTKSTSSESSVESLSAQGVNNTFQGYTSPSSPTTAQNNNNNSIYQKNLNIVHETPAQLETHSSMVDLLWQIPSFDSPNVAIEQTQTEELTADGNENSYFSLRSYYKVLAEQNFFDNGNDLIQRLITDIEGSIYKCVEYCKLVPGYQNLPMKDQVMLLKAFGLDWFTLDWLQSCVSQEECSSSTIFCLLSDHILGEELASEKADVTLQNMERVMTDVVRLGLSAEEILATKGVALMMPDRCVLEQRSSVEEYQNVTLRLLQCYLSKNRGDAAGKTLVKITSILNDLRVIYVHFVEVVQMVLEHWSHSVELPPIMSEFWRKDPSVG